jgi:hypothetical protein
MNTTMLMTITTIMITHMVTTMTTTITMVRAPMTTARGRPTPTHPA